MEKCKPFIVDVLKRNGAMNAKLLFDECRESRNCPKEVQSTTLTTLQQFLIAQSDTFTIKKEQVCLAQPEQKCKSLLLAALEKEGHILFSAVEQLLNTSDKAASAYLLPRGWQQGVVDFLHRNDDTFFLKDEKIFCVYPNSEADIEAVKYFSKILQEKGPISLTKLMGHWNQAPANVKSAVKSTKPDIFTDFLRRNLFYFKIDGALVSNREISEDMSSAARDDSMHRTVQYFEKKIRKKGMKTLQQLVSSLNHDGSAEIIGTVGSKKPSDIEMFLKEHPSVFRVEQDNVMLLQPLEVKAYNFPSFPSKGFLDASITKIAHANNLTEGNSCLSDNINRESKAILCEVLGFDFIKSLENLLSSINIKDMSRVEMAWFDLGKRPTIKILTENIEMKYVIHDVKDQPVVSKDFFGKLIQHEKVIQVSTTSYGIQGTLHTLKANWLGESIVGITLFHQIHLPEELYKKYKEIKTPCLRAIIYEHVGTTANSLYSYMRQICHNLAEHHHVMIVDFNGKITGFNQNLPPLVGKSRCISVTTCSDRKNALMEAFAHSPDYIVTNCLDVMDVVVLQTINDICEQGVNVVVAANQNCRKYIET